MRIKIFIVLFILATIGLSFRTVIGRTPVSNNTKVQEALADSLNDSGKWSQITFADGTSQTTASGGTVDGSGTTNEITYWVDSDTVGALAVATYPSLTELSYGKGVTSAIQTQLTAKAPSTSPTFATSITGSFLTASEILITDGSKNIVSAAVATYPSLTELTYVKGVSSAIQTQLGLKAPLASPTFTGTVTIPTPFTIGAVSMTSTGTELNILDGATLTVTELNYVDGVTSAIQTQLGLKAPLDSPVFTTAVTLPVGLTGVVRADTGVVSVDTDVTDLVDNLSYAKLADGTDGELITWSATGVPATVAVGTSGQVLTSNGVGAAPTFQAAGGTIDGSGTTNEVTYWVDSDTVGALAVATYPSLTELAYVKGVTSAIQTQLGLKAPLASPTFTGTVTLPVGLTGVVRTDTGVVSVDTDVTDLVTAASLTAAGKAELATIAEINTGTDTTRAIPIDQYVASNRNVRYLALRVVEATTDVAVASTKGGDVEMLFAGTITGIGAYNDTAGTTGTMTIDVHLNGVTLMTTNKITIDTAEKTSRTAAVAPALTTTAVVAGDLITIDLDAIHSVAAKGLTVWLSIRMN